MSSQNPRSPGSRRRIAGERRTARPEEPGQQPAPDADDGPDASSPVAPADPVDPTTSETSKAPWTPKVPWARKTSMAPKTTGAQKPSRAPKPPRSSARTPRTGAGRPARDGSGPSWVLLAVLGGLALLLVAAAAVLGLGVWNYGSVREQDKVDEASRTAPAAAERAAATILSFDYTSLDADAKAAERYMTPSYKKKYSATFAKLVRPNAPKARAKVEAEVKASGVSSADPDRVNVLLYVNQTTKSTANNGDPQLALNRVMLSMKRSNGSWLVDNITSY